MVFSLRGWLLISFAVCTRVSRIIEQGVHSIGHSLLEVLQEIADLWSGVFSLKLAKCRSNFRKYVFIFKSTSKYIVINMQYYL